jgi:hypothetical protein
MDRIAPKPSTFKNNSRPAPWEVALISYLVVLVRAQDARISLLEQLDRQKAVYIDEQRRRAA